MDRNPPPSRRDTGAQSGNDTQFLFSEGDIYHSDGDVIRRQATGKFVIPRTIKLLWIILIPDRPFLIFCISIA